MLGDAEAIGDGSRSRLGIEFKRSPTLARKELHLSLPSGACIGGSILMILPSPTPVPLILMRGKNFCMLSFINGQFTLHEGDRRCSRMDLPRGLGIIPSLRCCIRISNKWHNLPFYETVFAKAQCLQ